MYEMTVYKNETGEERIIFLHSNSLNPQTFSSRDKKEYPWLIEEMGKWSIVTCIYID